MPSPCPSETARRRRAVFDDGFREVPVYDGHCLAPGEEVAGPAIVEQETTTVVVTPEFRLTCDAHGNYLVYLKERGLADSLARCREGRAV